MRTIAALALLISANAFACPDLTGNYSCNVNGQKSTMAITQNMKGSVTVYTINGEQMAADNQVSNIPDDENLRNGTLRLWCDDTVTLKGEILGKFYYQGSYFGDLTAAMGFFKQGQDLKQTTKGEIKSPKGNYPIDQSVVCKKI